MTFRSAGKKKLDCMQKLRNEEENFLVKTSQLVGILRDSNKNVKKGLMNIMVLVRDVSCVSLSEILCGLITCPKTVGPRISLINNCKIQKLFIRRRLKKSDITKETKGLSASITDTEKTER
jgi:hypothetical protein